MHITGATVPTFPDAWTHQKWTDFIDYKMAFSHPNNCIQFSTMQVSVLDLKNVKWMQIPS